VRSRRIASNATRDRNDDAAWYDPRVYLQRIEWGARDTVAFGVGALAAVAILINALFLQSGPHPAPLFKTAFLSVSPGDATNAVVVMPRARPPESGKGDPKTGPRVAKTAISAPATPVRNDPIGALLTPSKRVMAVQRALSEFGYGQIKPSGIVDNETRSAIEKFERERKLPITGQVSARVTQELAAITGRPLD
jgi:putative peptidoglycan binding protein